VKLRRCAVAALFLLAAPVPALAAGPEQLDQIEPGKGEWQAELFGVYGGEQAHAIEALYGVSDRIAVGMEIEAERDGGRLHVDTLAATILFRLSDPEDAPLGVGIKLQGAFGNGARLAEAEARLILERRTARWWVQADAIVRHARDDGEAGTGLAYAGSLQRTLGGDIWFGVEASGQLARLGGEAALAPGGQHHLGPSLTVERRLGRGGIEFGLAYLQRIAGRASGSAPRLFVQVTF
jgi:hypothetical protein